MNIFSLSSETKEQLHWRSFQNSDVRVFVRVHWCECLCVCIGACKIGCVWVCGWMCLGVGLGLVVVAKHRFNFFFCFFVRRNPPNGSSSSTTSLLVGDFSLFSTLRPREEPVFLGCLEMFEKETDLLKMKHRQVKLNSLIQRLFRESKFPFYCSIFSFSFQWWDEPSQF